MFEISKYKKSNVKLSIRLPEDMNETLRKIAKKEKTNIISNICFSNLIFLLIFKHYLIHFVCFIQIILSS